jgi:hypothetical protein
VSEAVKIGVIVTIDCDISELRQGHPFVTASQFWRWDQSSVTIRRRDANESLTITTSSTEAEWRRWQDIRTAWEVLHGSLA